MITKDITFKDLVGNDVTQTHYFHITSLEAIEAQLTNGLLGRFQTLTETRDGEKAYWLFRELILMAYGRRHDDNIRFEKSEEITKAFTETPAFQALIFEFVTNAQAGADFFNGLFPKEMLDEVERAVSAAQANQQTPVPVKSAPLAPHPMAMTKEKDPKDMTREELLEAWRLKTQTES